MRQNSIHMISINWRRNSQPNWSGMLRSELNKN
jgi:hypothetical protein